MSTLNVSGSNSGPGIDAGGILIEITGVPLTATELANPSAAQLANTARAFQGPNGALYQSDGTQMNPLLAYNASTGNAVAAGVPVTLGGGITTLTGDVTASGTGSVATTLATSGVTAGTYNAANITVDAKGRVTSAANGASGVGTIAGSTISTSNLTSAMDNSTQTAAAAAVLTMPAGLSCPTGLVIDAPGGATVAWGSTYTVNGVAGAGSFVVGSNSYFVLRQMLGTDTWSITTGTQNGLIAPRTEGSTVTLVPADAGGTSVTSAALAVTVNTGLGLGFQRAFIGTSPVSFTGSATVTDHRTTGASGYFSCALICTAANTYDVVGSKT